MPMETLKLGEQKIKQGGEFRESEAHYGAIQLELDSLGGGSWTALGTWEAGKEGQAGPLAESGEGVLEF